jgi:hypothetical protein
LFEKKKQKTVIHWSPVVRRWHTPNGQKFFGSFFQKRTSSFPNANKGKELTGFVGQKSDTDVPWLNPFIPGGHDLHDTIEVRLVRVADP